MFEAPPGYTPSPAEIDMATRLVPSPEALEMATLLFRSAGPHQHREIQESGGLHGTILVANKQRGWWSEEVVVLGGEAVFYTKRRAAQNAYLMMGIAERAGHKDLLAFEFTVFPDGKWAVWSDYDREFMGRVSGMLPPRQR